MCEIVKKLLIVLITLILSGCAAMGAGPDFVNGDVLHVHVGTAIRVMQDAAAGQPGTEILRRGSLYLFSKGTSYGWLTTGINAASGRAFNPGDEVTVYNTLIHSQDMKGFVEGLINSGYEKIKYTELPPEIRNLLATGSSWISAGAGSLTTLYVVPVGAIYDPCSNAELDVVCVRTIQQ